MDRTRRIGPWSGALLVGLVVVVAACSDDDADARGPTPTTTIAERPSPATTPDEPADVRSDDDVLREISLTADDVPGAAVVELIPGGDEVENQVTLDFCGADFASEADRVARHQVAVRDEAGERLVGDEGVVYRTEADAAQALEEVRVAVERCDPSVFVESAVAGVPRLRFDLELVTEGLTDLTEDHVAMTAVATAENGASMDLAAVYLRRGRVVVGLYGTPIDVLRRPAALMSQRLEALNDSLISD